MQPSGGVHNVSFGRHNFHWPSGRGAVNFQLQYLYHSSCRHARAEKQEWNTVAKKTETELQERVKMVSDRNDRIVNGKKKRSAYI